MMLLEGNLWIDGLLSKEGTAGGKSAGDIGVRQGEGLQGVEDSPLDERKSK